MDNNLSVTKNVLVMSISKKVPLLKSVRKALYKVNPHSKLVGADLSDSCFGKFFVDHFWQMPTLNHIQIEEFINYCSSNQINAVIPTRDGELKFFAAHYDLLKNSNIYVMVSRLAAINICQDKLFFSHKLLGSNYPVIPSYESLHDSPYNQLVVKERFGTRSRKIEINIDRIQAEKIVSQMDSPLFQPYIEGEEYSIDVYINKKHRVKGCIIRKRDFVVGGESQITTSIKYKKLEQVISSLAEELQLYGHVMFQVIVDRDGNFHIIECNPRFGGASTLSIEMGLDSFYWFLLESNGVDLDTIPFIRSEQEKKLIRYPEDLII